MLLSDAYSKTCLLGAILRELGLVGDVLNAVAVYIYVNCAACRIGRAYHSRDGNPRSNLALYKRCLAIPYPPKPIEVRRYQQSYRLSCSKKDFGIHGEQSSITNSPANGKHWQGKTTTFTTILDQIAARLHQSQVERLKLLNNKLVISKLRVARRSTLVIVRLTFQKYVSFFHGCIPPSDGFLILVLLHGDRHFVKPV